MLSLSIFEYTKPTQFSLFSSNMMDGVVLARIRLGKRDYKFERQSISATRCAAQNHEISLVSMQVVQEILEWSRYESPEDEWLYSNGSTPVISDIKSLHHDLNLHYSRWTGWLRMIKVNDLTYAMCCGNYAECFQGIGDNVLNSQ